MSTRAMYDLKENLCANLDQYAKKADINRTDLDTVHLLTDTIKNIDKITKMEEEGNSYGDWAANGSYGMPMPYTRTSGRRGSRDGYSGNYAGNYSNDSYDNMENRMRREMTY